jgi:sugar phosphate isomerase/epimerase
MTRESETNRRGFLKRTAGTVAGTLAASTILPRAAQAELNKVKDNYAVGIYTRPWDQYDYRVALDAIAEAGFTYAGLMTTKMSKGRLVLSMVDSIEESAQIGDEAKRRGLQIPSVYGGGIPIRESLEVGIAGLRKLIDNCEAAGAKSLLMGGIGKAELYERYYKAIAECCDYAAEKGLPITVKPHGGQNATGPQCRKCIELVGHKNFSLWYDPGNILFYSNGELDPVDDAATVDSLVTVGMCIKDFDMVEKDGKPTRDVWVTPGTGCVNFPKVMQVLRRGGFTSGFLVIECVARGDGTLPSILAEVKKARQFVNRLVESGFDTGPS